MQQNYSHQNGVDYPQYLKHHPSADSDSSTPRDAGPFTLRLQDTQRGVILFSLHKAVVGKRVQPETARMILAIAFRLREEFRNMGWKTVYIKRYEKAHSVHIGQQLQSQLKILPAAEGCRFLLDAREKQPE